MEKGTNHDTKAHFEAARKLRRELALRGADAPYAKRELLKKNENALERIFRSALTEANFNIDGYQTIAREMQAELRRFANDARAKAGADHHGLMKIYAEQLRSKLVRLGSFSLPLDPPPAPPYSIVLNSPYSIYTTSGLKAITNIAPLNSTAKFSFSSNASSGYEEIAFSFAWQNPYDAVLVVNVDAYPIFRGYCEAFGDSGIFSSGKSRLDVQASVSFSEVTATSITPVPVTVVSQEPIASLSADGGSFFSLDGVGDIEWRDVYRGYDLRVEQLLIQPKATMQLDIITSITYSTTGDASDVKLEFAQDERAVAAYAVVLTIVS